MANVKSHFNSVSANYQKWKKKNWFYYQNIKELLKEFIPKKAEILDIGCGHGELLASLRPSHGVGIDISDRLIEIAKKKYSGSNNLKFYIVNNEPKERFDYIISVDVIEHVENIKQYISSIKRHSNKKTKILITMANPIWEPALIFLEKIKQKMPEGPHRRIGFKRLKKNFAKNNLIVLEHGYRQLLPIFIPFFSKLINNHFYKIPLIKNLGLTEYLILRNVKIMHRKINC